MNRRNFIIGSLSAGSLTVLGFKLPGTATIMTVNGPISADKTGFILEHEHILVDFIGAESYDPGRWSRPSVVDALLPYLRELKEKGCDTLFEFTPEYLGRDPLLLQELSQKSGLNLITNTGFYGAVENKYLPKLAFDATAESLASRWIKEFEEGIDATGIKPGFIKISVNPGPLSELHRKLVRAAALTHLKTGLTIASHTGLAIPAFEQIELIKEEQVHPSAFIWVHAQNEQDHNNYLKAANMGAWVSLDGVQDDNIAHYLRVITEMKDNGQLGRVLVSQDAGWYEPGKPWNGVKRKYTSIFTHLIPALKANGFSKKHIRQIFEANPQKAYSLEIRKDK